MSEQGCPDVKAYMEQGLISIEGDKTAYAQTGEPYVLLAISASVNENPAIKLSDVAEQLKKAFDEYKATVPNAKYIYWRREPVASREGRNDPVNDRLKISARLELSTQLDVSPEQYEINKNQN